MAKKRRSSFKRSRSGPRARPRVPKPDPHPTMPEIQPETLYRFTTTREALSALPEETTNTVILSGHIVNEITTLQRLLLFTMRDHHEPVLSNYSDAQSWVLVRLLLGVIAEGVDVIQNRIFGSTFGREYLRRLDHPAIKAARDLVGKAGLLRRLRSGYAFHNPSAADLKGALASMDTGDWDWSITMGHSRHSMMFGLSHCVIAKAMMNEAGEATDIDAINRIMRITIDSSDVLLAFFEQLFLAFEESPLFAKREAVMSMADLPRGTEVVIPPLCRDGR